ncbi:MAG: DnaA regulatory inactivator Hda [Hahellaceae bacterium]|nr:DnaA regulatory inactivator Hda [Hahellaceae bacterium]
MTTQPPFQASQLTLPLYARSRCRLENYVLNPGSTLLDTVKGFLTAPSDTGLYLHGSVGTGKTHLLLAMAHRVGPASSIYLNVSELRDVPADSVLEGLEGKSLICLDDLQAIAGQEQWETALFHLYNRCQLSGARLLFGATEPPSRLGVALPDLLSRLNWGVVLKLDELGDEQKKRVMLRRADERGIALSNEVLQYLFSRSQRDMTTLVTVLDQLDQESLTEKRHVTIPFIKKIMKW